MPVEPLHPGDPRQLGPYRVGARLGAGGMGVVYLADSSRGPVAVKTLRRELADQPELRARFAREIAVLQQVGGACTVRVLDANMNMVTPYLVTEYVPGPTLEHFVGANGPLTPSMQQALAVGLAEALVAIHAAGVVHRDLKPANVILGPQGPKVIDFGIAQISDAVSLTRAGLIVGSASFMAPEQVKGRPGAKADIFTWALTVGYACQGRAPFGDGPSEAVLYRTLNDEPDLSGVPGDLAKVLAKALVKDPATRPSAVEILAELTGKAELAEAAGDEDADDTVVVNSQQQAQELLSRTWVMPSPAIAPPPIPPPMPPPPTGQPMPPSAALMAPRPPLPLAAAPPPGTPPRPMRPVPPPMLPRRGTPFPRPPSSRGGWLPVAVFCVGLVVLAAVAVGILALSHGNDGGSRNGGAVPPSSTPTTSQGAEDPGSGHSHRSKNPKASESPQEGDGQDVPGAPDGQAGQGDGGTTQPGEGQVGQLPPGGDVQPQSPQPLNGLPFDGSTTTQPVPEATQTLPGPMVQGGVAPPQDGARQDSRTVVFVWRPGTTG